MQIFPCPFCGLRDEREFLFAGEAGNIRPAPAADVSAKAWAHYLHDRKNPRGAVREIWVHQTCQEYLILRRDSLSLQVLGHENLRKDTE